MFGPGGWLMTSSADGYVRIWNWRTGQELTSFDAGDEVSDSEFSSDGRFVVTASDDGWARIFSTALAGPINTLEKTAAQRVTAKLTANEQRVYLGG